MRLTAIVDSMFRKEPVPEDTYRLKYERQMSNTPTRPAHTPQRERIPIDPTGETIIAPPNPETERAKEFMGGADPSTIVDAQSDDEAWKKQRRIWLKYAGIATDADGNVIKK